MNTTSWWCQHNAYLSPPPGVAISAVICRIHWPRDVDFALTVHYISRSFHRLVQQTRLSLFCTTDKCTSSNMLNCFFEDLVVRLTNYRKTWKMTIETVVCMRCKKSYYIYLHAVRVCSYLAVFDHVCSINAGRCYITAKPKNRTGELRSTSLYVKLRLHVWLAGRWRAWRVAVVDVVCHLSAVLTVTSPRRDAA